MPTKHEFPSVLYRAYLHRVLVQMRGRLVVNPEDGRHWLFPEGTDPNQDPCLTGAYLLDPSKLERQSSAHQAAASYVYLSLLETLK